jgi:hypothetical protein
VRNVIEPGRDLGHVDRSLRKDQAKSSGAEVEQLMDGMGVNATTTEAGTKTSNDDCKDC